MTKQAAAVHTPCTGSAGYSLIEVVMAMLITCVMVTAVMGVAVSSKQGSTKGTHEMIFNQGISQLSSEVKQYVTACGCYASGYCPPSTCAAYPVGSSMHGPNTNNPNEATWYLNGAPGASGTITDSAGPVWALACGNHTVTGIVPALEASPYNGSISYNVTWPLTGCAARAPLSYETPSVTFTANWTEP